MLLSALHHRGATKSDMMMVLCLMKTPRQQFELTRWMVLEDASIEEVLLQALERGKESLA